MNVRPDRTGRAAAAILAAILVAAAGAAGAGDGAVPPFPGAGGGEAADGARAASHARPGTDAKPDEDGPRAGDAAGSDSPASGSRLLRALAEAPQAPASPHHGAAGAAPLSGPRVFAAEGCPRALLRRLLAGAVDEADALTALAIEREALTLCRERQEIVAGLFETEARLEELRAPIDVPAPAAAETVTPEAPAAVAGAAEGATEDEPPPSYGWFSIIGTAGALRAGITDGEAVWFVRVGDRLRDGGTVTAIAGRPPGVRLRLPGGGAEETPLPFSGPWVSGESVRARPGGGP